MKKILFVMVLILSLSLSAFALAEDIERNYAPEAGSGWMSVDIHGEHQELLFTECTKSMTGTSYNFSSDNYAITIMFDNGLKAGEAMGANAIKQIEIVSHTQNAGGYYFMKKTADVDVDCEVLLEKKNDDGVWQGTFSVVVHPGERWVGDLHPGMIADLILENGEFCFAE